MPMPSAKMQLLQGDATVVHGAKTPAVTTLDLLTSQDNTAEVKRALEIVGGRELDTL